MAADARLGRIVEVAAHLQVTTNSIYRWGEAKGLPAHRAGRLLRFGLSEVDAWMKAVGDETESPRDCPNKQTQARNQKQGGVC